MPNKVQSAVISRRYVFRLFGCGGGRAPLVTTYWKARFVEPASCIRGPSRLRRYPERLVLCDRYASAVFEHVDADV